VAETLNTRAAIELSQAPIFLRRVFKRLARTELDAEYDADFAERRSSPLNQLSMSLRQRHVLEKELEAEYHQDPARVQHCIRLPMILSLCD